MRVLSIGLFTALLSTPAFAADLGTYRPGTPYSSVVAPGADVCDSQCSGDAQCRGWNYVKPNPRAAGICEFLSSTSAPISSQISISGESASLSSYASRTTAGATNTVRVGAPTVTPQRSGQTVRVGQVPTKRRVVREAPTQRIQPHTASIKPVDNMSLTAQQNRYRQGQVLQQPTRQTQPTPRQMFKPILDGAAPIGHPQNHAPRPVPQTNPRGEGQRQYVQPTRAVNPARPQVAHPQAVRPQSEPRRATGPRNTVPLNQQSFVQQPRPNYAGPDPRLAAQQAASALPPVGQPVPPQPVRQAPTQQRPVRSTPSQRLAQFTAQTRGNGQSTPPVGSYDPDVNESPVALNAVQASKSLFGRLHDDVKAPAAAGQDLPTVSALPTQPITQEELAGGL